MHGGAAAQAGRKLRPRPGPPGHRLLWLSATRGSRSMGPSAKPPRRLAAWLHAPGRLLWHPPPPHTPPPTAAGGRRESRRSSLSRERGRESGPPRNPKRAPLVPLEEAPAHRPPAPMTAVLRGG